MPKLTLPPRRRPLQRQRHHRVCVPSCAVVPRPTRAATDHSLLLLSPALAFADPTIQLYEDGKLVDTYKQSRDAPVLQAFIGEHSVQYSKRRPEASGAGGEPRLGAGGDGTVVKLDQAGLDRVKKEGGFVKYFAPW